MRSAESRQDENKAFVYSRVSEAIFMCFHAGTTEIILEFILPNEMKTIRWSLSWILMNKKL